MRKLGYEVKDTGVTVWTLKEKRELENKGVTIITKLINIPEKHYKDDFLPWITVDNKLIRQHV